MKNVLRWPWKGKRGEGNKVMDRVRRPWRRSRYRAGNFEGPDGVASFAPFTDTWPSIFEAEYPAVDVMESAGEVTVKVELPGMSPGDIQVNTQDGVLTIQGEKKESRGGKWAKLKENKYGYFSRSLYLGENLEYDKADAKYKDGVLTLVVPKIKSNTLSREIPIS